MKIAVGEFLEFNKEKANIDVKVRVVSDRQVEYEGKRYFLSPLVKELLDLPRNVAPVSYWIYKGKNLSDIYDETYGFR